MAALSSVSLYGLAANSSCHFLSFTLMQVGNPYYILSYWTISWYCKTFLQSNGSVWLFPFFPLVEKTLPFLFHSSSMCLPSWVLSIFWKGTSLSCILSCEEIQLLEFRLDLRSRSLCLLKILPPSRCLILSWAAEVKICEPSTTSTACTKTLTDMLSDTKDESNVSKAFWLRVVW